MSFSSANPHSLIYKAKLCAPSEEEKLNRSVKTVHSSSNFSKGYCPWTSVSMHFVLFCLYLPCVL